MFDFKRIRETISEWIRPKEESPELNKAIKSDRSFKEDVFKSKGEETPKNQSYYVHLSRIFNKTVGVYEYFFLDDKKTLIRHAQDYDGDIQHQVIEFYKVLGDEFLKNNNVYIKLVKY